MQKNDEENQDINDRRKLLEEIRRRAEEAESRRLEEDENEPPRDPHPPAPFEVVPPGPTPFRAPSVPSSLLPRRPAGGDKTVVLRERFLIALDRGKIEKAAQILTELRALAPEHPDLPGFQVRLDGLAEAQRRTTEIKQQAGLPTRSPDDRASKEKKQKKIAELLEQADSLYQGEKYDAGLENIDQILALDPEHEEAMRLREQIEKAQHLAEIIKEEERRRKLEEAATTPPREAPPPPKYADDKDFWGTATTQVLEPGLDLPPAEKGPVAPPRPPLGERMAARVQKIHIPVRSLLTALAIVALAVAAYVVIDTIRNTVVPPTYSLLVLPGVAAPGDTLLQSIADGVTQDLIRDFSEVTDLGVVGAPTAFGVRNAMIAPLQSARALNSGFYLEWTLARLPEAYALQSTLHDTLSPKTVWTSRYQASLRELPALRLELVRAAVAAMGMKLSEEEQTVLRRIPTTDPRAYGYYTQARALMLHTDAATLASSRALLAQSLASDSNFADAHAALGWIHILMTESELEPVAAGAKEASASVQRAVELGLRSAETFRVWGLVEQFRAHYDKAVERLEQAVTLSPSDAESQRRLALMYGMRGRLDAAVKAAHQAMMNDPGNIESHTVLGMTYQLKGEYTAALVSYEQGLRLAPDRSAYAAGLYADVLVSLQRHERAADILNDRLARARDSYVDLYRLGRIEQSGGKPKQEWQSTFVRAKALIGSHLKKFSNDAVAHSYLALVQTRLGEFKDAVAAINHALQLSPDGVDVLYNAARVYALQRDKKQALEMLNKALVRKYSLAHILDMDFFNLRNDADFVTTITR
jgi:tetratricopeptide (TPR) repeat protein